MRCCCTINVHLTLDIVRLSHHGAKSCKSFKLQCQPHEAPIKIKMKILREYTSTSSARQRTGIIKILNMTIPIAASVQSQQGRRDARRYAARACARTVHVRVAMATGRCFGHKVLRAPVQTHALGVAAVDAVIQRPASLPSSAVMSARRS